MKSYSVYLLEAGCPAEPPVFPKALPSSRFPFWGHYCFYDFAAANLEGAPEGSLHLVVDSRFRELQELASFRSHSVELHLLEAGPGLPDLLLGDPAERVLLYPLSQVFLAEPRALLERLERPVAEVIRISVDHTATDLYVLRRKTLLRLLKELPPGSPVLGEPLNRLLAGRFELMEDLPGAALFQNSLMQMYGGNLRLCAELGSRELEDRFEHLNRGHVPAGQVPGGEIRIERGGMVRSSFLAAGTVVEGYVEDSVLFPGVSVRRGAVVYQSIVMSGNCIGTKAQVSRALILPHFAVDGGGSPRSRPANIGEDSQVGLRNSTASNLKYPAQARDGLTVLGTGVSLPRGFVIGPGCLVGAEVGAQQLRGLKELRKGATVLCSTEA